MNWLTQLAVSHCLYKTGTIKNCNNIWRSVTYLAVTGHPVITTLRITTTASLAGNLETTIQAYKEFPALNSLTECTELPPVTLVHIEQDRCTEKAVGDYHRQVLIAFNLFTTNFKL